MEYTLEELMDLIVDCQLRAQDELQLAEYYQEKIANKEYQQ